MLYIYIEIYDKVRDGRCTYIIDIYIYLHIHTDVQYIYMGIDRN